MSQPLLKVTELAKSFSGVWALSNAQLTVGPGEIHALLGKRGGKIHAAEGACGRAAANARGDLVQRRNAAGR